MTVTKQSLGAARLIWDITDPRRNDQMLAAVFDAARFVERLLPEHRFHSHTDYDTGEHLGDQEELLWDEGLVEVVAQVLYSADSIAHGFEPEWDQELEIKASYQKMARAVLSALAQEVGK